MLFRREAGRFDALHKTIDSMDVWLHEAGTDPTLAQCLTKFARVRCERTMEEITYQAMG